MLKVGLWQQARVRDVMTEGVVFLRAQQTLDEAWAALHAHEISAPVLGKRGRLVGLVSKADLADPRRRTSSTVATVEDVMTRVVYAVRANDPVMSAVRLMISEKIHRAIVANEDGSIAGIVAPMDILRALERGELPSEVASRVEYVDIQNLASREAE